MSTSVVRTVLGPMFIEVSLACALYGVTTIQCFVYYRTFVWKETQRKKLLVGAIWFLESVHTAFCIDFLYSYTIQHYGDYLSFGRINWAAAVQYYTSLGASVFSLDIALEYSQPVVQVLISAIVHSYYIHKVWITTQGNRVITAVLAFLALCHLGCGLGAFALSLGEQEWKAFRFAITSSVVMTVGLACAAAIDNLIALILVYYILRAEARGESPYGNRADLVLACAVDTGAVTAVFSLLSVVLFGTQRHSLAFLGFIEMQTKLYANCLLGSLNVRALSDSHTCGDESAAYQLRQQHSLPRLHFHSHGPGDFTNVTIMRETIITHEDGHSYDDTDSKSAVIGVATAGGQDDGKGNEGLL
ncbi:hypothetical protein C8Q74DRAFT_1372873 [Fomes fomentarius]|nr:hypothetical protein C8Q74DRAFT_1372873 [Fomes fomentarius]